MLRKAEVHLNQGSPVGEVCRRLGISAQTYSRRREEGKWLISDYVYTCAVCKGEGCEHCKDG